MPFCSSTATTILSLSTIKHLRAEKELTDIAKKMLSFADNRQDASLQAGHFNDFIEIGMLRGAVFRAAAASKDGLSHDQLPQRVFDALDLPLPDYASNPSIRFSARQDTDNALRQVLGYRLYKDLKRGWRINAPNLEQCGLLEIVYPVLDEVCESEDVWENGHPALVGASPDTRKKIAKVLLDHMRRELAIKVDYLDPQYQERIKQASSQRLIAPWGVDEDERMERGRILFPTVSPNRNLPADYIFLSERSRFAQYLTRQNTFDDYRERLRRNDANQIIGNLLAALETGGLVEQVMSEDNGLGVPGYQLVAAAMRWVAGEGTRVSLDPIRFTRQPEMGSATNSFFVDFYRNTALGLNGYEAREHTAQVKNDVREKREDLFKEGKLPVLYCSPTMELGVDIKDLNVVNMRNVPPTIANYAQRSGRAGRSGQPALIFTYCSVRNSHDQYFFKRPERMVSGSVSTPCLDLANEDLVRSHIQAVWLAETRLELGTTMKNVLDINGENPSLELLPQVRQSIQDTAVAQRAFQRSRFILEHMMEYLEASDWYKPEWLEDVVNQAAQTFDRACDRWRHLFSSAMNQAKVQGRAMLDASRSAREKDRAARLVQEARSQLALLLDDKEVVNSDFYIYRYFAAEGFLPGYGFPRLPLSAYIPGRKFGNKDDYLSRARFIAISEFGPNATVYHEGSTYRIHKVILPITEDGGITLSSAKCCPACGYLHPEQERETYDVCELCGTELAAPYANLFRMQNVSTQRKEKINSDEEERLRLGFEIQTLFRFNRREGVPLYRQSRVVSEDGETLLAQFKYGAAATIWRMNLGRRRRSENRTNGFWLDLDNGAWSRPDDSRENGSDETEAGPGEESSARSEVVIPFVEDRRNCLLLTVEQSMNTEEMASLQAALKRAIQVEFQLEDRELSVEPLPGKSDRQQLFFYESAEGGAGVLRRLTDDAGALARVARQALLLCHFDPLTGNDLKGVEGSDEECEAACYDCLLSYYNQWDHRIVDRKSIKQLLMQLKDARVDLSPAGISREEHLEQLLRLTDSQLEKDWLSFLETHHLNLPTAAQKLIESCRTRPDFWYDLNNRRAAVYIDGPVHLYPDRQARDREQEECLEDMGIRVIRFGQDDDWESIVKRYPDIFGDWGS
jgi:very-short-patch-repair endonuclease